jgi:2-amino-4-hydroxy-6-hydroxymethyldihydropteridine diphosphokinase
MSHTVYISIGSNLGDRAANIADAVARLQAVGTVTAESSLYETSPVEFNDQPWFVNAVVELKTRLDPERLMSLLLAIERAMGRERTRPKGPRLIDLDILLFDEREFHSESVDIPHPAMHQRRFVLIPLAEVAPALRHPLLGLTPAEMLDLLPVSDIVRPYAGIENPSTKS